jgi:transcriptional regulator with XRE-family HTH domain
VDLVQAAPGGHGRGGSRERAVPNPLLRQAREARNLTQDEVSEGLVQLGAKGVTGGLVSKWERGICRPNRFHRRLLCQFFDASPEELGFRTGTLLASSGSSEDALVDALIEPAGATIKLSWLVWYGHADAGVVERVTSLIPKLTDFTASHQGELRLPALRLLATAHEMLGKVAFDGLDYPTAFAHFLEMEQLGEAAGDLNLRTLAAIHQGDLLRRRGDYELAVKRLTAAMPAAVEVAGVVEGMRHQTLARAHAENGHKDAFLEAIEAAEAQASSLDSNAADWGNEFTLKQVRHERAHGHTLLWEPKVALGIYLATEPEMHPVSLRDVGNFTILKAQAHAYAGNVDVGVDLAIEGLRFARRCGSARHVSRVQRMYDRLSSTPIGTSAHMRDLADALHGA